FLLRLAVHEKRYGGRESEHWTTVERREFSSGQFKCRGHDRSFRSRARFSIAHHVHDLGVLKNGGVKIRRLFGFAIEPQEWGDFLHNLYSLMACFQPIRKRRLTRILGAHADEQPKQTGWVQVMATGRLNLWR